MNQKNGNASFVEVDRSNRRRPSRKNTRTKKSLTGNKKNLRIIYFIFGAFCLSLVSTNENAAYKLAAAAGLPGTNRSETRSQAGHKPPPSPPPQPTGRAVVQRTARKQHTVHIDPAHPDPQLTQPVSPTATQAR